MRWALILSGMGAAAMLALGFNMVLPLGGLADTVCALAGDASAVDDALHPSEIAGRSSAKKLFECGAHSDGLCKPAPKSPALTSLS
jgi:hypothetical protein